MKTCDQHNQEKWTCFEDQGTMHHIEGHVGMIKISTPSTPVNNIPSFMEEVRDVLDIGIVEVEDTDTISFGKLKELARKYE